MGDQNGSFENNRCKQEDELTALKSIYGDDVQDLRDESRGESFGSWIPLELLISVQPQESFSPDRTAYASLSLYIKCCHKYPSVKPVSIELRYLVGVPDMAVNQLKADLEELMVRNEGEVVIFILIDFIRQFLSPFNHPPVERRVTLVSHQTGALIKDNRDKEDSNLIQSLWTPNSSHVYSRFLEEFEAVEKLGEGGFGEVFKAKNKLDQRFYAVKKIPLNVSVKQQQKIFREVNLLSTLNHDNIVRYFSTWIESKTGNSGEDDASSRSTDKPSTPEKEAAEGESIFTTSLSLVFRKSSLSSNFIEFEGIEEASDDEDSGEVMDVKQKSARQEKSVSPSSSVSVEGPVERFMYIQMELCEKHTLKDAIDSKSLLNDTKRVMRLFREIVEGLSYLHESGIIHRDLKPVNIFIDAKDHAKIGDFGLATTDVYMREEVSSSGRVGTFYYTAPELDLEGKSNRLKYHSQKMDMYSLGVIFFEMLYRPMTTGMERHTILTNLRKIPTEFPQDFSSFSSGSDNESLIRSLLNPDPVLRPSSSRLQEALPPLDLEHRDKQRIIKQLTSNRSTRDFKQVIAQLFHNEMDDNVKVFYGYERCLDEGIFHRNHFTVSATQGVHPRDRKRISSCIRSTIEDVMKKFGAEYFSPATFCPKESEDDLLDKVLMMDSKGGLVYPCFSSRNSFARYVATHHVCNMRRYCIEKVFRKKTTPNPILMSTEHPSEFYEIAFDMIFPVEGPDPQVLPEAVLFSLLLDLQTELPFLSSKSLSSKNITATLVVSHAKLMKGIAKFCGVNDDTFSRVVDIVSEGANYPRAYVEKRLVSEGIITDRNKIIVLSAALDVSKDTLTAFKDSFKNILRKKQTSDQREGIEMVMTAINEMRFVCKVLDSLDHSFKYSFRTLLHSCLKTYSGFSFQLELGSQSEVSAGSKKCCRGSNIVCVGGRYDNLVASFAGKTPMTQVYSNSSACFAPGAVGLSIEFSRLLCLALSEEFASKMTATDVYIVAMPVVTEDRDKCQHLFNETIALSRHLRMNGCRVSEAADILTLDSLHQRCRDRNIKLSLVLREDLENRNDITARFFFYEKGEKPCERRIMSYSHRDVLEAVKTMLQAAHKGEFPTPAALNSTETTTASSNRQEKLHWQSSRELGDLMYSNIPSINQSNQSLSTSSGASSSLAAAVDVQFLPLEGKIPTHMRKRHEALISSLLSNAFSASNSNCVIHVIAVEISFKIVKAIVLEVDLDDDAIRLKKLMDTALHSLQEKYPRYRKHLPLILEEIHTLKTVKKASCITIFSYTDCRFVTFT